MAIYRCYECGDLEDGDWHPCSEHPTVENELLCEECLGEIVDRIEGVTPQGKQVFTADQLATIAKLEEESDDEFD